MLLEKSLKKLLTHLDYDHVVQIPFGNNDLTLHVFDHASKVSLSTPVYFGGNFIPSSVRKCAHQNHPFNGQSSIRTSLDIDEDKFQISLHYLNEVENLKHLNFGEVMQEFGTLAEDWRLVLDENDKNDLVYVRAPK